MGADDFGRAAEAADLNRAYLSLYPDDYGVRYNLANHLMQTRRYGEAVEQFQEVVRVWPAYAGAWGTRTAPWPAWSGCREIRRRRSQAHQPPPGVKPFKTRQIQLLTTIAICNTIIAICNCCSNNRLRRCPTTIVLRVRASVRRFTELSRGGARIDKGLHSQCL